MTGDKQRRSILIVTSRTGGGHINMSIALSEMLSAISDVTIIDVHPPFVSAAYSHISRHAVDGWAKIMQATDTGVGARGMHTVLYAMTRRRLADVICCAAPDAIISTHSMLSYEVTRTLRSMGRRIPVLFQITDVTLHRMWVTEASADAYLASTQEIFDGLLAAGISRERVALTGRPIRRQFLQSYDTTRDATLSQLGLDPDQFTVYVQGGAEGSANVLRTVEDILDAGADAQCVVATGRSRKLFERLSHVERVAAVAYTNEIAPLMAACDVVVGKPGAGSIFEAIALEKPFIASTLIPYQETPNVAFLERHGLGWSSLSSSSLTQTLRPLRHESTAMRQLVSNIRSYKAFNAAALSRLTPLVSRLLGASDATK